MSDSEDFDNETGEKMRRGFCIKIQRLSTNAETGEPEIGERILRKKFRVPLKDLESHQEKGSRKVKPRRRTIPGFCFRKDVGLNVVKEFALCKKRRVSPMVFMLPTLFICPGWASILCLLGEACMHMWSHKSFAFTAGRKNQWKKLAKSKRSEPSGEPFCTQTPGHESFAEMENQTQRIPSIDSLLRPRVGYLTLKIEETKTDFEN